MNQRQRNKTWLGDIYDDLTNLEINTIVKREINGSIPPEFDEVLRRLHDRYLAKLRRIIDNNRLDFKLEVASHSSFKALHKNLTDFQKYMAEKTILIEDKDYSIFLRMLRLMEFIMDSQEEVLIRTNASAIASGRNSEKEAGEKDVVAPTQKNVRLYSMDLDQIIFYDFRKVNPRLKARIRRMFDMNTEQIAMQTRFGIDGDVTSRISEDFVSLDQKMLMDVHELHTKLSIQYWKDLVSTVFDIVTRIFGKVFK